MPAGARKQLKLLISNQWLGNCFSRCTQESA